MLKTKTKYRSEIIFFVLTGLICFLVLSFCSKKILAAENGQVNLDAWSLTDMKKSGGTSTTVVDEVFEATLVYDNSVESGFKDIVIPNAADFKSTYPNLEKVWIDCDTMRQVASNANKADGSLKISDTDGSKIFAMDGDWMGIFESNEFITSIDLSGWDTSNVTDMSGMFYGCESLSSLDLSGWDTSNVTDMSGMFDGCESLSSLDLSGWDTSKVTDMDEMFDGCESLSSLDLSGWDTSNVTDMDEMFYGCESLSSLDLSGWDTSNVTDMSYMFYDCSNLISTDISGWDTSKVETMEGMFADCSNLTSVDLSGFDTGNVEAMKGMFYGCISLSSVDLSGFDTSNVNDMRYMFYGCRSLSVIDLSGWDTDALTDSAEMFKVKSRTPLLVITDNDFFENYDYDSDNRTLFTTTLKVDGKNVVFRVNKDEENVSYNADKTTKYINIYTTYTTTDTKEKILQKLIKRLKEEKNNLIVANGCSNLEWQPVGDYDDKVGYSLAGTYVIFFNGSETENNGSNHDNSGHAWGTVENSGGSSGGSSSASQNSNLISKNDQTGMKTQTPTESKIPEKLRTRKYLFGYSDGTIKPENYVTNAEFATVIYRLMNDGEEINYDKLKNIGVEKSDWFANAVAYLIDDSRKIINVTDEKFNPNKNITGYEMLNIIHNVLKFYGVESNSLYAQNLNSEITRAKMSEIIFKAFERKSNPGEKIYSDLNKNHWAYKFLMDALE